ncbi:MAG: hypothetical protein ACF8XB_22325 [Planctomycetota bacterium JB042]
MPFRAAPLAAAFVVLLACSEARNTPSDAFASLRTAIAESRWELLYEVLTPEVQAGYDEQIATKDAELAALARRDGPSAADGLLRPIGISHDEWKRLDARARFAGIFEASARAQFVSMGVNEEHLKEAEVRSVESHGGRAEVVVDDGKGHRTRLTFTLVDGTWRFDPGEP